MLTSKYLQDIRDFLWMKGDVCSITEWWRLTISDGDFWLLMTEWYISIIVIFDMKSLTNLFKTHFYRLKCAVEPGSPFKMEQVHSFPSPWPVVLPISFKIVDSSTFQPVDYSLKWPSSCSDHIYIYIYWCTILLCYLKCWYIIWHKVLKIFWMDIVYNWLEISWHCSLD